MKKAFVHKMSSWPAIGQLKYTGAGAAQLLEGKPDDVDTR